MADGGNLYLDCDGPNSKRWIFRYTTNGVSHDMSLGSVKDRTLAEARAKAAELRKLRVDGIDPLTHRNDRRAEKNAADAKAITFGMAAERAIAANRAGWRNVKHAGQWKSSLETHATILWDIPIQSIDTALVLKVLEPIWALIPETANRIRGRIESIIDASKARGEYRGENPARWRGHLDKLLPKRAKVRKKQNQPALPYEDMPAFMRDLRASATITASALEFQVLTASRPGNALRTRWCEIDRKASVWLIAGDQMKNEQDHKVPLSDAALEVLDRMDKIRTGEFVFFGLRNGRPLSSAAQSGLIQRMNCQNEKQSRKQWLDPKSGRVIVPHGFRSTFRTWGAERTNFAREVLEKALAHTVGDETERAYDRGDMFEKRRDLMNRWAEYCALIPQSDANVIPMRVSNS